MGIDTRRIPNERARRATENYERMNREHKDLMRRLEATEEGIRSLSALVTAGANRDVKRNITERLEELNLLPIEEDPVFEESLDEETETKADESTEDEDADPVDEDDEDEDDENGGIL